MNIVLGLNEIKEIIVDFSIYGNGIVVMFLFFLNRGRKILLVRNAYESFRYEIT